MRKLNRAKLCGSAEATEHLEVAGALTAALDAYRNSTDLARLRKLILPMTLPGLNEYITAERSKKYAGARMRKETEKRIELAAKSQLRGVRFKGPVIMHYTWVEPNRKRDKDNIAFAKKFVQDALVHVGILENDGWNHVKNFTDSFSVDKKKPRVEIRFEEA